MSRFILPLLILALAIFAAACNKKPQDAHVQADASVQSVSPAVPAPDAVITADSDTATTAQSLDKGDIACVPCEKHDIDDEEIDDENDDDSEDADSHTGVPVPKPNPAKDFKAKDFSDRKPFVLTVSTDIPITRKNPRARRHSPGFNGEHAWDWIDHVFRICFGSACDTNPPKSIVKIDTDPKSWKEETIRYLVAVHTVDGQYPLQYDLDCDGDGIYEHKNLKDSFVCQFKYNSGDHQIHLRGDIPAIWLCANGMLIPDPVHQNAIVTKSYLDRDYCNDGIDPSDFRCNLPYRQPTVCPASADPFCMKGSWDAAVGFDCDEEYKFCKNGYDAFAEDMYDRVQLVTSIDDWGDVEWKSMMGFAADCARLNRLPSDAPNLTQVTDMSHAFEFALIFNQPLEKWDVSHVKNMDSMFFAAYEFNQPLERWDISSVRNMDDMFREASSFSHYPENWILPPDSGCESIFWHTEVEDLAKQKPLRMRKCCSD